MRNPIAKSVRRIRPQAVPGVRNPPPNTEDWDDDGQYFCTRCATLCPPGRVPGTHYVHGHLACEVCGKNLDECCAGEVA
jgi:hypothetical protein